MNSQGYAQKPQRNCTLMNSASVLLYVRAFVLIHSWAQSPVNFWIYTHCIARHNSVILMNRSTKIAVKSISIHRSKRLICLVSNYANLSVFGICRVLSTGLRLIYTRLHNCLYLYRNQLSSSTLDTEQAGTSWCWVFPPMAGKKASIFCCRLSL